MDVHYTELRALAIAPAGLGVDWIRAQVEWVLCRVTDVRAISYTGSYWQRTGQLKKLKSPAREEACPMTLGFHGHCYGRS